MKTFSNWIRSWNEKVKKFTIWDLELVQIYTVATWLIVIKIFPQIMQISIWWLVIIWVPCAVRVIYIVWIRKSEDAGTTN